MNLASPTGDVNGDPQPASSDPIAPISRGDRVDGVMAVRHSGAASTAALVFAVFPNSPYCTAQGARNRFRVDLPLF